MSEEKLALKILHFLHEEDELIVGQSIGKLSRSITALVTEHFRTIHSQALACHCECLGMNAENTWAACNNSAPPFNQGHYQVIMLKWGLIDKEGRSII